MPDPIEAELADYIWEKWNEFRRSEARLRELEKIKRAREAYEQKPRSENFPWPGASNLVVPIMSITCDQLEPRLAASIVGRDEIVAIEDFGKLDDRTAELVAKFDNAVLLNDVRLHEKVKSWIKSILIDGVVFLMPYWSFSEIKTRAYVNDPITGLPKPADPEDPGAVMGFETEEVVTTLTDGVRIETIPPEDIYFPDRIDDWEDAPVIREVFLPLWRVLRHSSEGDRGWRRFTEEELEALYANAYEARPTRELILSEDSKQSVLTKPTKAQNLKRELWCLEAHVSYDIDGDGIEEKLIVVLEKNSKTVLYSINNNMLDPLNRKAVQPWRMFSKDKSAWGISIYEKVKEIERGSSQFINTLINCAMVQMIPWFFYEAGAGLPSNVSLVPGVGQLVQDVKKLFFPTINPTAAMFKDFFQMYISLWERIVALSDMNMGRQSEVTKTRATATGTLAAIQEAQILHEYLGSALQDGLGKIIEIIHDLYYMNATPEMMAEIVGQPVPKILSKNYKFKLTASTKSANRHVERMELQEALMIAQPAVQMGIVNPVAVVEDWLKTFRDIDIDEWMSGPLVQVNTRFAASSERPDLDPFAPLVSRLAQTPPEALQALVGSERMERKDKNAPDRSD